MSDTFPEDSVRYADVIDAANSIADLLNRRGVDAARARAVPEQSPDSEGAYAITQCVDCDEDLNAVRLRLGRVRCVACQTNKEKKESQYGRG